MAEKTIFISYSHADEKWLTRLKGVLDPLLSGTGIEIWDDSHIAPGMEFKDEITTVIHYSCAALLLVSPNFLSSDFITEHELPLFLAAASEVGLLVLWVLIEDCDYEATWLASYQSLHDLRKPLGSLPTDSCQTVLDDICRKVVGGVRTHPPLPFRRPRSSDTPHFLSTRLFNRLRPACFEEADLEALAKEMEAHYGLDSSDADGSEENTGITAGYTYLGQFIDNDITFPQVNASTVGYNPPFFGEYAPAFDLNGIYGLGPRIQPYLYQRDPSLHEPRKMALGDPVSGGEGDKKARQLPRMESEKGHRSNALVGDSRNDENIIISQLHAMMLRFHNRVADLFPGESLGAIQQIVRFHYQWVVIHDFLETIIGSETLHRIFPHLTRGSSLLKDPPNLTLYNSKQRGGIPLEFSLAVFRFGLSMVRPTYLLNDGIPPLRVFAINPRESLAGYRAWPAGWGIEWSLFFHAQANSDEPASKRAQYSYKIDTSILKIPLPLPLGITIPTLTYRNLIRGLRTGLPSGQSVSSCMNIPVIEDDRLTIGRATERDAPHNKPLASVSKRFKNNAPLWYYILAEAQQQFVTDVTPIRLGPLGGRIVGEVIVGLMLANPNSFLRKDPLFQPAEDLCSSGGHFRMTDLLKQASLA
jgi:hypothetical protein